MAKKTLTVETLTHDEATRKNAPTAELEPFVPPAVKTPIQAAYERRNPDLDPQLVWRGKDMADWSDLVVEAPPLYIQEKIHPKALVEDLKRAAKRRAEREPMADLFSDFNGVAPEAKTEFYAHDQHWSNRMILGDGLKVMASLAEREGLKGQVQCIYIDPPYGIKFNSNFQWSTTSRDVKDGKADHFSREPEQVKAFRDTWRDGIHSYLTYLRDRLTVARDLLTESGSVFVQIGDENVHRVRALMDEVFGEENYVSEILVKKKGSQISTGLDPVNDYILWYCRSLEKVKIRNLYESIDNDDVLQIYSNVEIGGERMSVASLEKRDGVPYRRNPSSLFARYPNARPYGLNPLKSGGFRKNQSLPFEAWGRTFKVNDTQCWKHTVVDPKGGVPGMNRLAMADYLMPLSADVRFVRYASSPLVKTISNWWDGFGGAADPVYVVQTNPRILERCILMSTDPGDLVLDPTCGSGTTAYVAEQWGRRWITMDTSRVALALARARLMGARYPWYLLADSSEGQRKEAEITSIPPSTASTHGRIRQGFVYKRIQHVTSGSIANNAEIDTVWMDYQVRLEPVREALNAALGTKWQEWEIPREANKDWPISAMSAHKDWWALRIARQQEIDASIAGKADTEYLYDQPYDDKSRVRVAGPFTVESLSPHRVAAVDVDDSLFDELEAAEGRRQAGEVGGGEAADFVSMVLDNLKKSGVQQPHKADRLVFTTTKVWPGRYISAEGRVHQSSDAEDTPERRAAILVGPEYGTVSRADLTAAAREAMEAGFDLLVAAAFNFDAHASEFDRMGALTVLQARINPDLHMPDLANTGAGNLFTVFGEPDIKVHEEADGMVSIEVAGIDMYKGGQIESGDADDIAVWFIDTDYNYESFFVRHAYFPGASDPYKALKSTLKADVDAEAWESLKRTRSRPFLRPIDGRVAVKVVNHLGDEVMKVVSV